jgi:hypothetical protein
MLHDLALSKGLLPLPVDHSLKLNDVAPSLQSRYRTFLTTTRDSAPAPRFGTLTLTGRPLESLPWHRCAGSHVPHKSLNRVHAAFVPDADWAVNRYPPDLSQINDSPLVLTSSLRFRQVISGSLALVSSALT